MKHIGMDVHSATTDITVLNSLGEKILHWQVATHQTELVGIFQAIGADLAAEILNKTKHRPQEAALNSGVE
jgi:hypothetical protein